MAWDEVDGKLVKVVEAASFPEALDYVNRVGALAEERNHHPDIFVSWKTVRLTLSTHSEGGVVTDKDRELASAIDAMDEGS